MNHHSKYHGPMAYKENSARRDEKTNLKQDHCLSEFNLKEAWYPNVELDAEPFTALAASFQEMERKKAELA